MHILRAFDEGRISEDCDFVEDKKGKKRAASPSAPARGRRKRARIQRSPTPVATVDVIAPDEVQEVEKTEDERLVPVYLHTYEFVYTRPPDPKPRGEEQTDNVDPFHRTKLRAEAAEWLEEVSLWVEENAADKDEPATFDLGLLNLNCVSTIGTGDRRFVTARAKLPGVQPGCTFLPLCTMPSSRDFDVDAYGIPVTLQDHLAALCVLQAANRVKINLRLHLIAALPDSADPNSTALPFKLRLDLEVALRPAIFEPVLQATMKATTEIEDAQRRVFLHIFPTSGNPPPSFHGSVDIPLLYSILGPAPRLPTPTQEEGLQPEALVPTLLPFQRRSVAWLLKREGKAVDESGAIVQRSTSVSAEARNELPLFWEEIQVEREPWYWNRVRGVVSLTFPKEEVALGGILAEEPGLGKTLECIALIMLNPAIERGPSNKRWDPEAKVHVKETKVGVFFHYD